MEAITYFAQQSMKKNAPELRPGDTVRVHQKIREGNKERIQVFEGVVIAVRGEKSISSSFVVRRIASGVGVEKVFPLHSPNVVKVERVKSAPVRQARLYYLRERFGRSARLRGEVFEKTSWDESGAEDVATEGAVAETAESPVVDGEAAAEVVEGEEAVESTDEVATEPTDETTEESPEETPSEVEATSEDAEAPAEPEATDGTPASDDGSKE